MVEQRVPWPNEPVMEKNQIVAQGVAAAADGKPIKHMIFDFGKVLVNWDPFAVMQSRYTREMTRDFLNNDVSGFFDANMKLDAGAEREGVIAEMAQKHGQKWADAMTFYLDNFEDSLQGNVPGARVLLQDLKKAGIGVWGLSNWERYTFEYTYAHYPILHELDGKVVSYEVGLAKPDPKIFELALDRFHINPEEAVFVDDKSINIIAANDSGIRGICFSDARELRRSLIKAGVNIPDLLKE